MHRQFASSADVASERVALSRESARHLVTVLRLGIGDEVELFDGAGACATFRLGCLDGDASVGRDPRALLREGRLALVRIDEVRRCAPRRIPLILAPCVSKGARMDWTVEKAVELGATQILPIASDNCVVSFEGGNASSHVERWRRIAIEAARQCVSAFVPEIAPPVPLDAVLASLCKVGAVSFAGGLCDDAIPFRNAIESCRTLQPAAVAWLVGPEGDFSPREYNALRTSSVALVSLGPLVLRTETAAIFGLCVLSTEWSG